MAPPDDAAIIERSARDARPWLYGIAANLIGKHTRSEIRMLRACARTGADPVLTRGKRQPTTPSAASTPPPPTATWPGLSRPSPRATLRSCS